MAGYGHGHYGKDIYVFCVGKVADYNVYKYRLFHEAFSKILCVSRRTPTNPSAFIGKKNPLVSVLDTDIANYHRLSPETFSAVRLL